MTLLIFFPVAALASVGFIPAEPNTTTNPVSVSFSSQGGYVACVYDGQQNFVDVAYSPPYILHGNIAGSPYTIFEDSAGSNDCRYGYGTGNFITDTKYYSWTAPHQTATTTIQFDFGYGPIMSNMASQARSFAATNAVPIAVVGGAILFVAAIGFGIWLLRKMPHAK